MRLLHRNDRAGLAIKSMVARLARQLGIYSDPSHAMVFPKWEDFPRHIRKKRFFLRSLLESGSLADTQLMRGGDYPPLSPNTAIGPINNFNPHIYLPPIARLHDLLYQPDPDSPDLAWIDPLRYSSSPSLLATLGCTEIPRGDIHLHPGQFWASNGPKGLMEEGLVWEIINIPTAWQQAGTIWARPWESHRVGHPRGGTTITPRGGGVHYAQGQSNSWLITWRQCSDNRLTVSQSPNLKMGDAQ